MHRKRLGNATTFYKYSDDRLHSKKHNLYVPLIEPNVWRHDLIL